MGALSISEPAFPAETMEPGFYLVGLINKFNNALQATADAMLAEISWKQAFFLNCSALFEQPPTIRDMAQVLGCSHQNAKQILVKLEKTGFVRVAQDPDDRRKQRICLTEKATAFRQKYEAPSDKAMNSIFGGIPPRDLQTTIDVLTALDARLQKYQEERI